MLVTVVEEYVWSWLFGVWKGYFLVVLVFTGWLEMTFLEMTLLDVLCVGGWLVFSQAWDNAH